MIFVLQQPRYLKKKSTYAIGIAVPGPLHRNTSGYCLMDAKRRNVDKNALDERKKAESLPSPILRALGMVTTDGDSSRLLMLASDVSSELATAY
ncbi:uncharacterized protein OGAPODRAFT_17102 [Ogataea polymorpha]|uniref:uncharacterized protein n=1 Tax=Ogataea polymorpha TaxID=460523 RepID=UPI0007F4A4BC|nr:uncharacterized protein OGAPODRAFT_17102 [Ogataea polymorpha]OBA14182.1 hypothetical protein OGAPODRAFT_17102 [Ogataea polymorpha]